MPMPLLKEKTYRLLTRLSALLVLGLCAYWIATESGPQRIYIDLMLDDDGMYPIIIVSALTILTILVPYAILMLAVGRYLAGMSISQQYKMDELGATLNNMGFKNPAVPVNQENLPSPGLRMAAFAIDRGLTLLFILIQVPFMMFLSDYLKARGVPLLAIMIIIIGLTPGIIYAYVRDGRRGQSFARKWLKMRVVDVNTRKPIGPWKSFLRELMLHLAPFLFIEVILLWTSPDRRRLGDIIAKSIVIKDDPSMPH